MPSNLVWIVFQLLAEMFMLPKFLTEPSVELVSNKIPENTRALEKKEEDT